MKDMQFRFYKGVIIVWKEVELSEWNDIQSCINQFKTKDWIFRGQSNVEWNLMSSLFREFDKARDLVETNGQDWEKKKNIYENELIQMFKSQSHLHINLNPDNYLDIISILQENSKNEYTFNRLEWLSIMQHYGAPTRLLDWTFSPYIGLYFGVENATSNFCMYALNLRYILKKNKEKYTSNSDLIEKLFSPKQSEYFVYPYEPQIKNERIVRQQGLFLVPSSNYRTFDRLLSHYDIDKGIGDSGEEVAYKLIFKKTTIIDCVNQLKLMNITPETLFPGVEGFCRSFKLHLLDNTRNLKRIF